MESELAASVRVAQLPGSAFPASGSGSRLIVGTGQQYEPMFDTTGSQPRGFDIDLAHALAERLGKSGGVTFRVVKSSRSEAAAGSVDVGLQAISITPERERVNLFSIPYLSSRFVIVVHPDIAGSIRSTALRGKVCAVGPNALYTGELKETGCTLKSYSSNVAAMGAVERGEAALTITDETHAETLSGLVNTGVSTGTDQYGVAMKPGNHTLKNAVDESLRQLEQDGTLLQLRQRYGI